MEEFFTLNCVAAGAKNRVYRPGERYSRESKRMLEKETV